MAKDLPHSTNCQCSACRVAPCTAPHIIADSYRRKTCRIVGQSVEYTGTTWIVNYKIEPFEPEKYPPSGKIQWMHSDVWNRMCTKPQAEW